MSIIAIADDDPFHCELLSRWLSHYGHEVHAFQSGDDLVCWLLEESPQVDVFLVDVDMPGHDGFQSVRMVRSVPNYAETPLAFVTAAERLDLRVRAGEVRSQEVFRKDARMLPRITTWLGRVMARA